MFDPWLHSPIPEVCDHQCVPHQDPPCCSVPLAPHPDQIVGVAEETTDPKKNQGKSSPTTRRAAAAPPTATVDSSAGSSHHQGIASSKLAKLDSFSRIALHDLQSIREGRPVSRNSSGYCLTQQVGCGQSAGLPQQPAEQDFADGIANNSVPPNNSPVSTILANNRLILIHLLSL